MFEKPFLTWKLSQLFTNAGFLLPNRNLLSQKIKIILLLLYVKLALTVLTTIWTEESNPSA